MPVKVALPVNDPTSYEPSRVDEEIYAHALEMARTAVGNDTYDLQGLTAEEYIASVKRLLRDQTHHLRRPYMEWRKYLGPEERRRQQRLRALVWLFGMIAFIIVVNIAEIGISEVSSVSGISQVISSHEAVLNLFLILLSASVWVMKGPHRTSSRISKTSYLLNNQFSDLVRNLVLLPAVSAAFQVKWLDPSTDEVRFQDGPSLSSKADRKHIVVTAAHNRLSVALTRRNGCSIGVAGPRGSGKTELARAFTDFRSPGSLKRFHNSELPNRTIPLFLWAPTKDDADIFMLRMLKELCISIISIASGTSGLHDPAARIIKHRQRIVTALVATTLIGIGTSVLAIDLTGGSVSATVPIITASTLIWAGLGAWLWVLVAQPRRSGMIDIKRATLDLAATLRSRVDFTETLTTNSQIGISTYGLNLTAGRGVELVRMPLNSIDVIREIRSLVDAISEDGWQVIIAIDEMDKMPSQEAATKFLNHIKVLFPIAGCSFVVSVSEMAWSLFERRGMPLRDVLDSSFDEIIHLDTLSAAESRDLLKRRDRGISDPQALLCHCLSGGLPRDLLRWARTLARTAAENRAASILGPPRLDELLDQLVEDDLIAKILALRVAEPGKQRSPSPHAEQATRSWLSVWPDCDATEQRLTESWNKLQDSDETEDGLNMTENLVYVAMLHTIRQAFSAGGPLSRLKDEDGFDQPIIGGGFERIAHARSKLALNPQESWLLLGDARGALGLRSLDA
jgi:hypothetical protein